MYEPTPIEEAFKAEVIADSISPYGIRLTTLQLRYPRFIHAEFMTHRQFSRNARSSRAVPVSRLVEEAPYFPHFLRNQPGMQAFEELDTTAFNIASHYWDQAADYCRFYAEGLNSLKVHKQWANRLLEWFGYIDVVVSSTYWRNFFNLRDHPAAMPEIQHLAIAMRDAIHGSSPRPLDFGQWHLPYITEFEYGRLDKEFNLKDLQLCSTARCARVSYKPFDVEDIDYGKDMDLAQRLIQSEPLHASPAEHQATPDTYNFDMSKWDNSFFHGNFLGWQQHRKMYPNEAYNEDYSEEAMSNYYDGVYKHAKEDNDILANQ